jgi:hypothetical protein
MRWLRITSRFSFLFAATLLACKSDDRVAPAPPVSPPPATADAATPAIETVDYVVVAANPLSASAERLKEYRESTGHKVTVGLVADILGSETDRAAGAARIRDWVKARYDKRDPARPFFLVLLGDSTDDASVDGTSVPAVDFVDPSTKSKIITDNTYADMDGDDIPDLAVGRIAVSSDAEADVVLEKTKRFESSYEIGEWNRRLSLFASTAGFGDQIDAMIEALVFKLVEDIPYDFDINLTYAKQSSPYVFIPERFSDKVYERLNEGSLMMTYVGHGYENGFATLDWNGKSFPILDTAQLAKIKVAHKSPVLTLIACLTGRFTSGESLSEQILKAKDGPIAVYSSTEVSHPYANAVFIRELSQTLAAERTPTIGEIFMRAKRRSIENNDPIRKEIDDGVSSFLMPKIQESLRHSHLYMYTLFGDPAARVAYPKHSAKVTAGSTTAAPGSALSVSVSLEGIAGGSALVTLETPRSKAPSAIALVPPDSDPTRDDVIAANYTKANDRVVARTVTPVTNGSSQATLTVPQDLTAGDYWVKVYADDGSSDAVGSTKITVP